MIAAGKNCFIFFQSPRLSLPRSSIAKRNGTRNPLLLAGSVFVIALLLLSSARVFASSPSISAAPSTFGSGASVLVTGTGFSPGASIKVWLDTNNNGKLDTGEPTVTVTADPSGAISISLPTGGVPIGAYFIRAGPSTTAMASTLVIVNDVNVLAAITNIGTSLSAQISSISTSISGTSAALQTHLDASISSAASSVTGEIDSQVYALQTHLDSQLGTFSGGDTAASLLYSIKSDLKSPPAVSSDSGTCVGGGTKGDTTRCTILTLPTNGMVTVTIFVSGGTAEAGAEADLLYAPAGDSIPGSDVGSNQAFLCSISCVPDGYSMTVSAGTVQVIVLCTGTLPSCSTPFTVDWTYTAIAPPQ